MGGKGGGESAPQQYPSYQARNQPEFKNQTLAEKLGGQQLPITPKKDQPQPITETQVPVTAGGPLTEGQVFSNPTGALVEGAGVPPAAIGQQPIGNQLAALMRGDMTSGSV